MTAADADTGEFPQITAESASPSVQQQENPPAKPQPEATVTATAAVQDPPKPAKQAKAAAESANNAEAVTGVNTTFQNAAINSLHIHSSSHSAPRTRTVGKLDEKDIGSLLRNFVTPRSYNDALQALSADHVVVLEGRPGDGRQAAAVSLLQELTEERLNMLTPITSLTDLAEREYETSQGYLIVDRIGERETPDTDFIWRTVRDRVRTCTAYLVITSATSSTSAISSVRHLTWERLEQSQILKAHLLDPDEHLLTELASKIPETWRTADVARVCERINQGEHPDRALETFGTTAKERVREWFDAEPPLRDVLAVATLCFATGTNHREFEAHLTYLDNQYRRLSETGKEKTNNATELPARRKSLLGDSSLIAEERRQVGLKARTELVFRSAADRRWVLERLWRSYDSTLWDAIRAWIDDSLMTLEEIELAYGLSLLAEIDYDEVDGSYLYPWSRGESAWPGQVAATYVLWLMCTDDAMSRLALRTATRWATQGSPAQRWTAAIAFSGELGRQYPADAVRKLWQLIIQGHDTDPAARFALAGLFSYLVSTDSDASLILRVLSRHVRKFAKTDMRLYNLTMSSILAIFTVWDDQVRQPSIFRLLRTQPERMELIVSLLANLLRNHVYRKAAIEALIAGIKSREKASDDAQRDVREIGEALSDALSEEEQASLLRGIQALYNRSKEQAAVLEALLRALANTLSKLKRRGN